MDLPPDPPAPSLAAAIAGRLRGWMDGGAVQKGRDDWRVGVALALLLAAGPLATIVGAQALAASVRRETAARLRAAGSQIEQAQAADAARAALAPLLVRPGVASTLDGLARVIPGEASLVRAERGVDGRLTIEVAAPDPDRLRAVLRRDPLTQTLRDAGQRAGEAGMIVTLQDPR